MKNLFQNLTLVVLVVLTFVSCSSSDEPFILTVEGEIFMEQIQAERASARLNGSANSEDFYFAIREKGVTNFARINSSGSSLFEVELTGLVPAQEYELTILADENPNLNFEIVEFMTPPFNTMEDQNSTISNRRYNYYSEVGFEHQLQPDTYNENANIEYYLIGVQNENEVLPLSHTYTNGLITFTIPNDLLSDEPYEEIKDYYLGYSIREGEVHKIPFQEIFPNTVVFDGYISLIVFNPQPQITGVEYVREETCSAEKQYELNFSGYFFNKLFEGSTNYYFDNAIAVVTRVGSQSEILIEEQVLQCIVFDRLTNTDQVTSSFGFNYLHLHKNLLIEYPDTNTGDVVFTSGDYKIKITFSSSADPSAFAETNDFEFTLP